MTYRSTISQCYSFEDTSNLLNSDNLKVAKQLNNYIDSEGLSNVNQSAYRRLHSTESVLLKIQNDIAASMDSGKAVALTLLSGIRHYRP